MIRVHRTPRVAGALLLAAVVGLAPGCTLFDEVLPGTPFTPDQPLGEVTVVGRINVDRVSGGGEGCSSGRALLWGIARNTGDIDVDDVFIEIDTLNANGDVIETYRANVFNGEVTGGTVEDPNQVAGTSLAVDESGTFEVCTRQAFGSVAGTAYRTDFIVVNEIE